MLNSRLSLDGHLAVVKDEIQGFRFSIQGGKKMAILRVAMFASLVSAITQQAVTHAEGYGVQESSSSYAIRLTEADRITGIDSAAVVFVRMIAGPDPGVPVILWTDGSSLPIRGEGRFGRDAFLDAKISCENGDTLKFHSETTDGKSGWAKVDDKKYDLANGCLFLIKTKSKKPEVKQLKVDVKKAMADFGPEKLAAFARSKPEIVAFWSEPKKGKEVLQ